MLKSNSLSLSLSLSDFALPFSRSSLEVTEEEESAAIEEYENVSARYAFQRLPPSPKTTPLVLTRVFFTACRVEGIIDWWPG